MSYQLSVLATVVAGIAAAFVVTQLGSILADVAALLAKVLSLIGWFVVMIFLVVAAAAALTLT